MPKHFVPGVGCGDSPDPLVGDLGRGESDQVQEGGVADVDEPFCGKSVAKRRQASERITSILAHGWHATQRSKLTRRSSVQALGLTLYGGSDPGSRASAQTGEDAAKVRVWQDDVELEAGL